MWFEKAQASKYWSITISYDPHEMTNIYIWDSDSKKYDTCYLLDWNSKNAGKALAEIVYEQQKERLAGKQLKAATMEAKINLNAEIDAIVVEAKQSKSIPVKTKSERASNIRANRTVEREAIRSGIDAADSDSKDEVEAFTSLHNNSDEVVLSTKPYT